MTTQGAPPSAEPAFEELDDMMAQMRLAVESGRVSHADARAALGAASKHLAARLGVRPPWEHGRDGAKKLGAEVRWDSNRKHWHWCTHKRCGNEMEEWEAKTEAAWALRMEAIEAGIDQCAAKLNKIETVVDALELSIKEGEP